MVLAAVLWSFIAPNTCSARVASLNELCRDFGEALRDTSYIEMKSVFIIDMGGVELESEFEIEICRDDWTFASFRNARQHRTYVSRGDSTWTFDHDRRQYAVGPRVFADPLANESSAFEPLFSPPFSTATLLPILAPTGNERLVFSGLDSLETDAGSVECEHWTSWVESPDSEAKERFETTVDIWRDAATGAVLRSRFRPDRSLPLWIEARVTGLHLGHACPEGRGDAFDGTSYGRVGSLGAIGTRTDLTGRRAPEIHAVTLDRGERISSPGSNGPTIVGFWASWCLPCRAEMELLAEVRTASIDPPEIVMISKEAPRRQRDYLETRDLPFVFLVDEDARDHESFGVTHVPMLFLVDRLGVVRTQTLGMQTERQIEELFRQADRLERK